MIYSDKENKEKLRESKSPKASKLLEDFDDNVIGTFLEKYLQEKIVKKGSKYQVQSEKGRNLGTYNTKEEAKKRLKQVEYFKHVNEEVETNTLTLNDIVKEFKLINNALSSDAVYILREGKIMDTRGPYNNHQHINVAKYVEEKTGQKDNYQDGSLFMLKRNAIRFTSWIPSLVLPSKRITREQEETLIKIFNELRKIVNENKPLMVSNYQGSQYVEFKRIDPEYILEVISDYYSSGQLTEELKEDIEELLEYTRPKSIPAMLSYFCNNVVGKSGKKDNQGWTSYASLLLILSSTTLASGLESAAGSKNKGYISLSYELTKIHDREPEKYPCGIVFDTNSLQKSIDDYNRQITSNDKYDELKMAYYHDIDQLLRSIYNNVSGVRISSIQHIIEKNQNGEKHKYFLNFTPYNFSTSVTINKNLYLYIQKNLKKYLRQNVKEENNQKIYTYNVKEDYKNSCYITFVEEKSNLENRKPKDNVILHIPEFDDKNNLRRNALIDNETDENEVRIVRKGFSIPRAKTNILHIATSKYKSPIILKFEPSAIKEILLPKIFEELKGKNNPDLANIIDSSVFTGSRAPTNLLKKFSVEDIVAQIIFNYPKKIKFI